MFCTQCGQKVPDTAKFCSHCGASLGPKQETAPSPDVSAQIAPETVTAIGGGIPSSSPQGSESSFPSDEWSGFFESFAGEFLEVSRTGPRRYEYLGERKIKGWLSRTTLRYSAVGLLDPQKKLIQWWDKLSESSFGITPASLGGSLEISFQKGKGLKMRKVVKTPGAAYAYSYGEIREAVQDEAERKGWAFELLILKP